MPIKLGVFENQFRIFQNRNSVKSVSSIPFFPYLDECRFRHLIGCASVIDSIVILSRQQGLFRIRHSSVRQLFHHLSSNNYVIDTSCVPSLAQSGFRQQSISDPVTVWLRIQSNYEKTDSEKVAHFSKAFRQRGHLQWMPTFSSLILCSNQLMCDRHSHVRCIASKHTERHGSWPMAASCCLPPLPPGAVPSILNSERHLVLRPFPLESNPFGFLTSSFFSVLFCNAPLYDYYIKVFSQKRSIIAAICARVA